MGPRRCQQSVVERKTRRILVISLFMLCLVSTNVRSEEKKGVHQDLLSVSFPSEQNGWACGRWGTVLHTSDGGASWSRQESGTDFTLSGICFVDSRNGWAVGDEGTILHTENGGRSWVKQESPIMYCLMDLQFADAKKGWIVTERSNILSTEDGGKSWLVQFADKDVILKAISFFDDRNGWAAGEYGYIYHTDDGGKSWEHQAGEFNLSARTAAVSQKTVFDVVALSPMTAVVVGIEGYVARTSDAGGTWQELTIPAPKTHLFGIASDKQGAIVIGGDGLLLTSSDEGQSFMVPEAEPPVKYGWIYGIATRGRSGFVAVGSQGWIYLSDRRATSWRRIEY